MKLLVNRTPTLDALIEKRNVMMAVVLRDMRTRFFDHGLGYLVSILWPLAHMGAIMMIHSFADRSAPYGESTAVFIATGLVPTLAFMYVSRFMCLSVVLNRPMMAFPVVTTLDIMMARAFLEVIAAFCTLALILLILYLMGNSIEPNDPADAALAYLCSLFLGIGVGSLACVTTLFFTFFVTAYALFMIVVYVSSGTLFVGPNLPDYVTGPLSWNPVFQCVEWMRVAFYPSYSDKLLDRPYVVTFSLVALCLGLGLERLFRGKSLEG